MAEKAHLGRHFLEMMRKRGPDEICMIDAGTGESASVGTVLTRSVQLARCFRRLGLRPGDVLALAGTNHLQLRLPYYAALMAGLPVAGVDPLYKYHELKKLFSMTKAKIVFCQIENYETYKQVVEDLALGTAVVTFGGTETSLDACIAKYDSGEPVDAFQATDFDSHSVYAWLVSTSGSTGSPKLAACTHRHLIDVAHQWVEIQGVNYQNAKNKRVLILSPVQWISGFTQFYGAAVVGACIIQTSKPDSTEHTIDIINKYKPTSIVSSPTNFALILKQQGECNFECFDTILLGGAKLHAEVVLGLRAKMRKDASLREAYGQTESCEMIMTSREDSPIGSLRLVREDRPNAVKLVDISTGEEVKEPHKNGELWWGGPKFDGYYNNPEETAKAMVDGWLRTGDIFYFDEFGNYYFVERAKMLIKCRGYTIAPPELEEVILTHPGVKMVAVTKVPHDIDGDHPVACIVRHRGAAVTAEEIKKLVIDKLTSTKQLRGGVIFMDDLPQTSTGKIAKKVLENMVQGLPRE